MSISGEEEVRQDSVAAFANQSGVYPKLQEHAADALFLN